MDFLIAVTLVVLFFCKCTAAVPGFYCIFNRGSPTLVWGQDMAENMNTVAEVVNKMEHAVNTMAEAENNSVVLCQCAFYLVSGSNIFSLTL